MTNEEIKESIQDSFNSTENMNKLREVLLAVNAGLSGPLVYKAVITQEGTNAPDEDSQNWIGAGTSAPMVDTIGGAWGYDSVGNYTYTKVGAFADDNKWRVILGQNRGNYAPDVILQVYSNDADSITFTSSTVPNLTGGFPTAANDLIGGQPITIEIYP